LYEWIDGVTYTESNNTATYTLTNAAGCDSVVTLNLTIGNSSTETDVQTACDSYEWIDGVTYTESNNTATYTLTNAAGCDSVVTLNLTIGNSSTGTDVQTACDSYEWIDGLTYTESNNTATYTLANAAGCDSVVTLNLTIGNSSTGTDVQTACDSYEWIDGVTYTESNNTATFTLVNAAGCDSVVTLDLTIGNSTTGTDVQTACDSYEWIDGVTYIESNNTATYTLTNAEGCDSVITLDLTINLSTSSSQTFVDYTGFSVTVGDNTYTTTGIYTDVLIGSNGCDSTVTTDLTIYPVVEIELCAAIEYVIPAGSFDPIDISTATFDITLENGDPLPEWLTFDPATLTFSGEAPCEDVGLNIIVTCSDGSKTEVSYQLTIQVGDPTGIEKLQLLGISVYPNPSEGIIYIKTDDYLNKDLIVKIYDVNGQVVYSNYHLTETIEKIDLSNNKSGIYFIQLINDKYFSTEKIIIE